MRPRMITAGRRLCTRRGWLPVYGRRHEDDLFSVTLDGMAGEPLRKADGGVADRSLSSSELDRLSAAKARGSTSGPRVGLRCDR